MSEDKTHTAPQGLGLQLGATLTTSSTLTMPEKAALSNTTTLSADPLDNPRPSKDVSVDSNPFDTDIEACPNTHELQNTGSRNLIAPGRKSECQVWPGKDHWKERAKTNKAKRSCTCMAKLSRRNRIIAKLLIIFLIVGIAVGVGFGVSKPLNAPIWGDDGK